MQNERSPAEFAAGIDAGRDRLIGFVDGCTDVDWRSAPLDGDPRPVGVVVDHVAHAYEYLAGGYASWSRASRSRSTARSWTRSTPSTPGPPPR